MKKSSFTEELNTLFDSFVQKRKDNLQEAEKLRKDILQKIDVKIDELYARRNFVAEILANRKALRKEKISVWKQFWRNTLAKNICHVLSIPFIYGMIIPMMIMHVCTEIYHQICFRLYGIPLVNPKEYFMFDRRKLPQLNWLEKLNCFYCSYYNCLIAYLREIGARTERYWCPIKHAMKRKDAHSQYEKFVESIDAKHLHENWKKLRDFEEFKKK